MTKRNGAKKLYRVTHVAFCGEYVLASDPDEAKENAVGGFDSGDYVKGHAYKGEPEGPVGRLLELDYIGERTVQRLLDADGPVPLGPASDLPLRQRDETRLKNRLYAGHSPPF